MLGGGGLEKEGSNSKSPVDVITITGYMKVFSSNRIGATFTRSIFFFLLCCLPWFVRATRARSFTRGYFCRCGSDGFRWERGGLLGLMILLFLILGQCSRICWCFKVKRIITFFFSALTATHDNIVWLVYYILSVRTGGCEPRQTRERLFRCLFLQSILFNWASVLREKEEEKGVIKVHLMKRRGASKFYASCDL